MRAPVPVVVMLAALTVACGEERQSYVPNVGDGSSTPTMTTTDVSTFISDSGYTRYHVVTPIWLMYEEASDPFWRFPEGIDLEQYNKEMQPESNIRSDSATYYSRRRLWRLDGNVVMVNTDGDSFLTQQLFWNQQQRKFYSDSFIHIVRTDRIIEGYGFESEENMRSYTVHRPTGIIPVDQRDRQAASPADTAAADSTGEATSPGRRKRAPIRASRRGDIAADPASAAPSPSPSTVNTIKPAH